MHCRRQKRILRNNQQNDQKPQIQEHKHPEKQKQEQTKPESELQNPLKLNLAQVDWQSTFLTNLELCHFNTRNKKIRELNNAKVALDQENFKIKQQIAELITDKKRMDDENKKMMNKLKQQESELKKTETSLTAISSKLDSLIRHSLK